MFGLNFLFSAALWALPLAALPILIHLVVRSKAPIVPFSTLRFVRTSLRQTAGRRRLKRWTLLGCRIALLALLIWAVAQPARRLEANWSANPSIAAAIVVDTSYSMALHDGNTTLLTQADQTANQLLSQNLNNAQVAIFTSQPNPPAERFQSAEATLTNWKSPSLQPALSPLEDRIAAATDALKNRPEDQKWLVIVTDLQTREFPAPLSHTSGIRAALIDLHPKDAASNAIVGIRSDPPRPRSGIGAQAVIDVLGRPGESVAINLSAAQLDTGQPMPAPTPPMAQLDNSGRAALRLPITFSGSRWIVLTAALQTPDRLPWAAARSELVNLPPPAPTQVLTSPQPNTQADSIVRLALDPSQGARTDWPIALRLPGPPRGDETVLVANLTQWPDESTAAGWSDFVRRGGILILFTEPGLEQIWPTLPQDQQNAIAKILPGLPTLSQQPGPFIGSIARPNDPLLADIGTDQSASGNLRIDRLVPTQISDPSVQTLLQAGPWPLLARRTIGSGQVYLWTTLPSPLYGNLPTSELFLPILVNSALATSSPDQSLNQEIGRPLIFTNQSISGSLDLYPPKGAPYRIAETDDAQGHRWIFNSTSEPGIYTWKQGDQIVAYSNVQLPAAEADLQYRLPTEISPAGPDFLIATSAPQLQTEITDLARPQPRWSAPIALVLLLLCIEMMLGSVTKSRRPTPIPSPHVLMGREVRSPDMMLPK
jgi:hypothetical protein